MKINILEQLTEGFGSSDRIPVIFAGHGSPMNAIEQNEFSLKWREIGNSLPIPNAIVCISAHWETRGSMVTAMAHPRTIHDFGGFPPALYKVEYPAPGNPQLARDLLLELEGKASPDESWGLDHGTWSILAHMCPGANIPVIQLSLDLRKSPAHHFEFAKLLLKLRNKGILVLGSGNMVHNLGLLNWNLPEGGSDWAIEASDLFKKLIAEEQYEKLINYPLLGKAVQLAIPTAEHYLPMLYILALKDQKDEIRFFNDKAVMGSLTMTSFILG